MTGESILIVLILTAITGAALLLPFVRHNETVGEIEARKKRESLLTAYERVLITLHDLEEDLNTGKLAQDEYEASREKAAERGVALLQQLEAAGVRAPRPASVRVTNGKAKANQNPEAALDAALEAAIAEYANAQTDGERR